MHQISHGEVWINRNTLYLGLLAYKTYIPQPPEQLWSSDICGKEFKMVS